MPNLVLDIALSAERMKAVYQGHANRILIEVAMARGSACLRIICARF